MCNYPCGANARYGSDDIMQYKISVDIKPLETRIDISLVIPNTVKTIVVNGYVPNFKASD